MDMPGSYLNLFLPSGYGDLRVALLPYLHETSIWLGFFMAYKTLNASLQNLDDKIFEYYHYDSVIKSFKSIGINFLNIIESGVAYETGGIFDFHKKGDELYFFCFEAKLKD